MKKIIILIVCFFPLLGFSQLQEKFKEMNNVQNPNFEDYDELLFEATSYIFSHPVNPKSKEFIYAIQIPDGASIRYHRASASVTLVPIIHSR
jgi:hypothetical protein